MLVKKQHLLTSLRKTERNIFVPSGLVTGVFEELPLEFDGFHTPYDLYIENGEIRVRRLPDMEPPDDVIAKQVRAKRDRLIAETDYLAMSDYPLSDEDKAAVMAYRQALRDVPTQEGFPREVVWPEVPAVFKRTKG